jgi:hypothetical protein
MEKYYKDKLKTFILFEKEKIKNYTNELIRLIHYDNPNLYIN